MAGSPKPILQAAALPVRRGRVCLVTSRSGKRWVLPKGHCEPGQTAGQTALQEAWEEAGLRGVLHKEPIGSYLYSKSGNSYLVTVFLMDVITASLNWPEQSRRKRIWLPADSALARIEDYGLREIIRAALEPETASAV